VPAVLLALDCRAKQYTCSTAHPAKTLCCAHQPCRSLHCLCFLVNFVTLYPLMLKVAFIEWLSRNTRLLNDLYYWHCQTAAPGPNGAGSLGDSTELKHLTSIVCGHMCSPWFGEPEGGRLRGRMQAFPRMHSYVPSLRAFQKV
jgi:hypothetical protein